MNDEQQTVAAEVEGKLSWVRPRVREIRAGGAEFSSGGGVDGSGSVS